MPESNNIPKGFDLNKRYQPIKTEQEKEHFRKKSKEWFADPKNHKRWKEITLKALEEQYNDPERYAEWYAKNSARLDDPKYLKKLSKGIKQFHIDNPNFKKELAKDPKWIEAHAEGCRKWVESPDYVHPKGMLGKTLSEESRKKMSEAQFGKENSLEGNAKISEHRKGWTYTEETKQKISKALTGRTHSRVRSVMTPKGEFEKTKDAAVAFNVTPDAIRLWVKDDRKPDFYFTNDATLTKRKKVITPDGVFENVHEAHKFYNISGKAIAYRIKKWDGWSWED